MWEKYKPYVISILIALGVGGLSAFLTKDSMNIYEEINTPPLSPPGWLFPIVWGVLFVLMGFGAARVYTVGKKEKKNIKPALKIYGLQLAVNFLWSILFFNMRAFLLSFVWLIFLWVLVFVMIERFKKIDETAAYLQIPYILWISFAGYLNLMIWLLNK